MSLWACVFEIVSSGIGVGMFALPYGFMVCGFHLAVILLALSGILHFFALNLQVAVF